MSTAPIIAATVRWIFSDTITIYITTKMIAAKVSIDAPPLSWEALIHLVSHWISDSLGGVLLTCGTAAARTTAFILSQACDK